METSAADSIVAKLQESSKTQEKLGTTQLLFACAQRMGLQPSWLKPRSLFAIFINDIESYVYFACSPLNSAVTINITRNKNLTRLVLARHALPNIPFLRPKTHDEAQAFLEIYSKIIAKPHNGSGSRDIHIITEAYQLEKLDISQYILEKYIVGQELRYLVLNNKIIGVHRSDYGTSVDENRYLERVSYPSDDWDPELTDASLATARALNLNFGAVDFLIDKNGKAYILEVNSSPGLKWFHAPTSGPVINVAQQFLEAYVKNTESLQAPSPKPWRALTLTGVR